MHRNRDRNDKQNRSIVALIMLMLLTLIFGVTALIQSGSGFLTLNRGESEIVRYIGQKEYIDSEFGPTGIYTFAIKLDHIDELDDYYVSLDGPDRYIDEMGLIFDDNIWEEVRESHVVLPGKTYYYRVIIIYTDIAAMQETDLEYVTFEFDNGSYTWVE